MSVYKKLATARVELEKRNVKKSGRNAFNGFEYFQLHDFLPHVNRIFNDLGLCGVVSFTNELATLTIYDCDNENGDKVVITSPMKNGDVKGCTEIQRLGAVQTYQRRYLYLSALEITDNDVLDDLVGSDKLEQQSEQNLIDRFRAKLNSFNDVATLEKNREKLFSYLRKTGTANEMDIAERIYSDRLCELQQLN